MLRKRNDSVKRGQGIDGGLGENYTDAFNVPDMQFAYPGNREVPDDEDIKGRKVRNEVGHAAYSPDSDGAVRRTDDFEHGSGSRQIWEDVEANQNPGGEFDSCGPITAGVSRSQK